MMASSNGNIFRVTGHLCGEFTSPRWIPAQRPVTRSFDVCFDLHLNKRLIKQSGGWWFEILSHPLWCHCNVNRCNMAPTSHCFTASFPHLEWDVCTNMYTISLQVCNISMGILPMEQKCISRINSIWHIDGLVHERHNSIANTLELHLSCTNPSTCIMNFTCTL